MKKYNKLTIFHPIILNDMYQTGLILKLTKVSSNQLKYWVKIDLVCPQKVGKFHFYSFRDIIKLKLIVMLKENGLSLQKIRKGIKRLSSLLPDTDDLLTRLVIHTNGVDMFVNEKGKYFSATTMQQFFQFDTEQIESDIVKLQNIDISQSKPKLDAKSQKAS